MTNRKLHIFYRPSHIYMVLDALLLLLSFYLILWVFPLSTPIPFEKYWDFTIYFAVIWMAMSYFFHRYVPVRLLRLRNNFMRLVGAAVMAFLLSWVFIHRIQPEDNYSVYVLLSFWMASFAIETVTLTLIHAYLYAQDAEPEIETEDTRGAQQVLSAPQRVNDIDKASIDEIVGLYIQQRRVQDWLKHQVDIYSTNTHITTSVNHFDFTLLPFYRFDAIVNLTPLNNMRGINQFFGTINDRLPDQGLLVVCFEPQSARKQAILRHYPWGINYLVYFCNYVFRRMMPKLFWTRRLYFDITQGKQRVLSPTEVLGRLCYCGFEIVDELKHRDRIYVVARRKFHPKTVRKRVYGVFVKLNRIGKDSKYFEVYKLRTMHPYAEFLQEYIYKKNSLQEGGKFSHDTRVSTLGRLARKYWFDELPMFINFFRGEMKLVGVRPISKQYYSLYCEELQDLRTHFKPGLLPPFYADMPKTLDEIQESELRYLRACETQGVFRTDVRYFFRILNNIIFRGKRSH